MLYEIFNKKAPGRTSGKKDIYSLSFANAKLNWRRNRAFETAYGKEKNVDLAFSLSAKSDGMHGDVMMTTWLTKVAPFEEALINIRQSISSDTISEETKENIRVLLSHFAEEVTGLKELKNKEVLFFPDKIVAIRFEKPATGTAVKNIAGLIFADNYFVGLNLYAFTENRNELAAAQEDFNEVISSVKINEFSV